MRKVLSVMVSVGLSVGCNVALPTRVTPREPLDALWESRMLEGRGVQLWLDEKWQPGPVREGESFLTMRTTFTPQNDPTAYRSAFTDPYAITVLRHVEGYWRNGGWTLTGGPLGIAIREDSTIELFGKAIIRTAVHIPSGMLHRDPPTETGYEFFLLRRPLTSGKALVIQRWVVHPVDVVRDRDGYPRARALLRYEQSTRVAEVSITGIRQPINARVQVPAPDAAR